MATLQGLFEWREGKDNAEALRAQSCAEKRRKEKKAERE